MDTFQAAVEKKGEVKPTHNDAAFKKARMELSRESQIVQGFYDFCIKAYGESAAFDK